LFIPKANDLIEKDAEKAPITPALMKAILHQYALPPDGIHGIGHWARVYFNGMSLADSTGADHGVVALFAVFHDACRINENSDPEHGIRGANLAKSFHGIHFELPDEAFQKLQEACKHHTESHTHQDLTIQICWDSDRLDLGRVGIMPDPKYLCTDVAKNASCIEHAYRRSIAEFHPAWISEKWGMPPYPLNIGSRSETSRIFEQPPPIH
jgi:uncharacterized protein